MLPKHSDLEPPPVGQLKLFRDPLSGHCHRVELFLSILDLRCEIVDIDVEAGEARTAEFTALNSFQEVPVLWHGERLFSDSNAILVYLGTTFDKGLWLPRDAIGNARVQRWLSIAAGELLNGPVTARRIHLFNQSSDENLAASASYRLLRFMDEHLFQRCYLTGDLPTVADIAMYSYTAHAPEGGISLAKYAHVKRWIEQIERWPKFVGMPRSREIRSSLSDLNKHA